MALHSRRIGGVLGCLGGFTFTQGVLLASHAAVSVLSTAVLPKRDGLTCTTEGDELQRALSRVMNCNVCACTHSQSDSLIMFRSVRS